MPWTSPTLRDLRQLNRDNLVAQLRSAPLIPNSDLRVMADTSAGMAFLNLMYLSWLSLQLLPDTAELDWLIRWANIKGVPIGQATFATGTITTTGIATTPIPAGSQLTAQAGTATGGTQTILFQTTAVATQGSGPTAVPVVALTAGQTGLAVGGTLAFFVGIPGVNGSATIATFADGVPGDDEDLIRSNVLFRLREPPMGGDANDYVAWALEYPGCTRAWCSPQEMGPGTVTIRFMMDVARATTVPTTNGFPLVSDVAGMVTWLNTLRPVTVMDIFVEAPIPQVVNVVASNMITVASQGAKVTSGTIDASTNQNIIDSVTAMLFTQGAPAFALNGVAQPAQTIAAVWISDAILQASGVEQFDFSMADQVMASDGNMAVMGTLTLT
jgi:uncharacterized phage protein gp47/JayE